MHGEVQDATGDDDQFGWMEVGAEHCPKRFAEWAAAEFRAKRLLARQVFRAEAASTVLGTLLDD